MNRTPSKPLAALWMAGWLALMLIVAVAGREAVRELNVFELMAIRSWIGLCLLYPLIWRAGGFSVVKTRRLPLHIARNTIHFGAQLGWFYALTLIPIGQVVAIEFTMPIWTAILAASFLGERMTIWKITAILRPQNSRISEGRRLPISTPSNLIEPLRITWRPGSRPMTDRDITVLPEPDSPTSPSVSLQRASG